MLGSKYGHLTAQGKTSYTQNTLAEKLSKHVSHRPQFRFHKNLATSRYDEFLAESDDEEFFNSKPLTKDGNSFDFDFKIDTYRDQIKYNKHRGGKQSQKKLIMIKSSRGYDKIKNALATGNSYQQVTGTLTNQHDKAVPDELSKSILTSLEKFGIIEDLAQKIPFYGQQGPINQTLLRCADGVFKVNYAEMNELKVATLKQMKAANAAMMQRNVLPIFSGNIECYLVN